MKAPPLIYRFWSPRRGESPAGHVIAILAGSALVIFGMSLAAAVAFFPAGVALTLLGFLILGAGVFAHIRSPLKWGDLLETAVGLAGAAIAMTFALVAAAFLLAMGMGIIGSFFEWARRLF